MNEDIRLQLTKIGNDAKKASNALSMASEDKKNRIYWNTKLHKFPYNL